MIKQLLTPLFIYSSLYAEEIEEIEPLSPEVVQGLYIETALFVAVFTLMSIISIVISKKHAAQNELADREKREKQKAEEEAEEEAEKRSQPDLREESAEEKRVTELSQMLKDGLITDEEFQVLNNASKTTSHLK